VGRNLNFWPEEILLVLNPHQRGSRQPAVSDKKLYGFQLISSEEKRLIKREDFEPSTMFDASLPFGNYLRDDVTLATLIASGDRETTLCGADNQTASRNFLLPFRNSVSCTWVG
jgi:hypothetical protein